MVKGCLFGSLLKQKPSYLPDLRFQSALEKLLQPIMVYSQITVVTNFSFFKFSKVNKQTNTYIFNLCLRKGTTNTSSYCPTALLSSHSETFEINLNSKIFKYQTTFNLFSDCQHGSTRRIPLLISSPSY